MKKSFLVKVEYDEKDDDILSDIGLELWIDDLMQGYEDSNSIKAGFDVTVQEVPSNTMIEFDDGDLKFIKHVLSIIANYDGGVSVDDTLGGLNPQHYYEIIDRADDIKSRIVNYKLKYKSNSR